MPAALIINPKRRPVSAHRARLVADAVVSVYIHEIASRERAPAASRDSQRPLGRRRARVRSVHRVPNHVLLQEGVTIYSADEGQ
jgi:hypothetical protein